MKGSNISDIQPILAIAIMEMCRAKKGESFCPSEVVKWIYPESWQHFMEDVLVEMMKLYQIGMIEVTQNKIPISPDRIPKGELRIKAKF
ncbi:DUF3253 domain-containing protein [Aquiflexum sp. TKW24L]|uniref:DUF3253 domain-containing protein n=1 Tax=Aquiflexum sp. TKW24L TaxID=2942212 RepID=UPI0020C15783|nr:DUF3253 domain-containing protein [Aquiflexum sp. TKW24L]MCL6259646.1 DUF3253 domain-containing protein [Aquiflexum sp. TKW24L]